MATRRFWFTAVAVALGLALLEGGARVAEILWEPEHRTLPLPWPRARAGPEFWTQVASDRREVAALMEDDQAGWKLTPSSVKQEGDILMRINALGLRGPEVEARQPGEVRILTLGDSSIYGVEVPETWVFSSVAARILEERTGAPHVAFIGGVPGYDVRQSRMVLGRVGRVITPDWVVIGTFWSDVFRADAAPDREAVPVRTGLRRLAAYRLLRQGLAAWLPSRKIGWVDSNHDIGSLAEHEIQPHTPLATWTDTLTTLAGEVRALGGRPVFLLPPAPMDFDRVPPPDTVQAFREAMRDVARQEQAPLVDGPAVFTASGDLKDFIDQVHPSVSGHARLGQAVAEAILAVEGPVAGPSTDPGSR